MSRLLKPCGTHAAYVRHWSRSEPSCEPCQQAERDFQRERFRLRRDHADVGRVSHIDPVQAADYRLTREDSQIRRCGWCGCQNYGAADCTACAAPADRTLIMRERAVS